jgi:cell wall-associated NlpC family hydrolase
VRTLLVVMIASLTGALLPVVTASAAPRHLVGAVESVKQTTSSNLMYIVGWVADTSSPSGSVHVSVWIDGKRMLVTLANRIRPDVNKAHKLTGRHGIRVTMRAPAGAKWVVITPYNSVKPDVAWRRVVHVAPPVQPAGTRIVAQARRFLGTHNPGYVMGGTSPTTGFDCSGYTQYAYRAARVANLPRTAEQQRHAVRIISAAQARPGDLVFYLSGGGAYHIAIYAGNRMQYAAATEQDGIKYQGVWSSAVQYGTTWH